MKKWCQKEAPLLNFERKERERKFNIMTEKQKQLVSDNHGLIYMFLQEQNLPVEEYYDLAAIGLCKAAIEFNIGSSDFPSFAWNYMNNAVTEEVEREKFPEQSIVYIQEEEQKPNSELLAIPSK